MHLLFKVSQTMLLCSRSAGPSMVGATTHLPGQLWQACDRMPTSGLKLTYFWSDGSVGTMGSAGTDDALPSSAWPGSESLAVAACMTVTRAARTNAKKAARRPILFCFRKLVCSVRRTRTH